MTEAQKTIARYLRASAGTANMPSLFTIRTFVVMVQTGEATLDDFRKIGGDWLVEDMKQSAKDGKWGPVEKVNQCGEN